MNQTTLEQLAALVDGYLPEDATQKLIDEALKDESLQAAWMRYHIIGDALRNSLPEKLSLSFATRVSLALEKEPILIAPRRRARTFFKPLTGWAIAASIVVIAVFIVQKFHEDTGQFKPQAAAEQALVTIHPLPVATVRWNGQHSPTSSRLSSYLLNHYNSNLSVQGVSPYVRIVSYEANQ